MKSFLQFLAETTAAPQRSVATHTGSHWFNSNTGQSHHIDYGGEGVEPATYHAGFVAKNPHLFGMTEQDLVGRLDQYESKMPGSSGKRMLEQLKDGYYDTHPVIDNAVMKNGWVRVVHTGGGGSPTVYGQGSTQGLYRLAKHIRDTAPTIRSLSLDVHGAHGEYGHLDPSIYAVSHVLEGHDDINSFIESGGKPNRRYTRILRKQENTQ